MTRRESEVEISKLQVRLPSSEVKSPNLHVATPHSGNLKKNVRLPGVGPGYIGWKADILTVGLQTRRVSVQSKQESVPAL